MDERERTERSLALTTGGLTLVGVLLGIGTTVGRGPLARLAAWILGPTREDDADD
jgi:hypothetical protein